MVFNLPKTWKGKKSKNLALKPNEMKRVTFKVMPPAVEKKEVYPVSTSFQMQKKVVEAAQSKLEVAPIWRVISVEGPRVLVQGEKSKAKIRLIANGNVGTAGKVRLKPAKGLEVDRKELLFNVAPGGEQQLEFEVFSSRKGTSELGVEVITPRGKKRFKSSYRVIGKNEAVVVTGDIMNRLDYDIIMANSKVEVQLQKEMGGRPLAFYLRASGANMLYQNYPKVEQREGNKDWVEYGGINDWFPGGWPGEVWNGSWEHKVVKAEGEDVVVTMWTTTEKGLRLERTMTLVANSRELRLDYNVGNETGGIARYQWYSHPDFAPGGENFASEYHRMIIPVKDPKDQNKIIRHAEKFIAKIDKDTFVPREGWVVAVDTQSKDYIMQKFDPKEITQIGIWQDSNFYTMELLGKEVSLKPAETRSFTIRYLVGNNNWEEEL